MRGISTTLLYGGCKGICSKIDYIVYVGQVSAGCCWGLQRTKASLGKRNAKRCRSRSFRLLCINHSSSAKKKKRMFKMQTKIKDCETLIFSPYFYLLAFLNRYYLHKILHKVQKDAKYVFFLISFLVQQSSPLQARPHRIKDGHHWLCSLLEA